MEMDSHVQRFQTAIQALKRMEFEVLQKMEAQITGPQIFMLFWIRKNGKCKLSQLAELMEVKPSAVTVMIDRLEKSGYVQRTHDTVDRRSILVEVTPSGQEVLDQALRERNEVTRQYLSRLEPDEVRMVIVLLEKMMKIEPPDGS